MNTASHPTQTNNNVKNNVWPPGFLDTWNSKVGRSVLDSAWLWPWHSSNGRVIHQTFAAVPQVMANICPSPFQTIVYRLVFNRGKKNLNRNRYCSPSCPQRRPALKQKLVMNSFRLTAPQINLEFARLRWPDPLPTYWRVELNAGKWTLDTVWGRLFQSNVISHPFLNVFLPIVYIIVVMLQSHHCCEGRYVLC